AQSFTAAQRAQWTLALDLAGQGSSDVAKRIVEWRYLQDEGANAPFEEIARFLVDHPNWPRHDTLLLRAEKAMPPSLDPRLVIDWYGTRSPMTGEGMVHLGEAQLATGKTASGTEWIRQAWIRGGLTPIEETALLNAHGDIIAAAQDRAKLERFLEK